MGSTEFGNGGLFEREREREPREGEEEERSERSGKVFQTEGKGGHDTRRHALEELWCKTVKPQIELSLFAVFFIPFFSCYYIS